MLNHLIETIIILVVLLGLLFSVNDLGAQTEAFIMEQGEFRVEYPDTTTVYLEPGGVYRHQIKKVIALSFEQIPDIFGFTTLMVQSPYGLFELEMEKRGNLYYCSFLLNGEVVREPVRGMGHSRFRMRVKDKLYRLIMNEWRQY